MTHRPKPITPADLQAMPDSALLRVHQFIPSIIPVHRATWYRWVADGKAPKPLAPSPNVRMWTAGGLRAALQSVAA